MTDKIRSPHKLSSWSACPHKLSFDSLTPELDFQQTKTPAVDDAADINDSDNLLLDLALDNKLETQ